MKRVHSLTFISLCLVLFSSFTASGKKEEMKLRLFKGEHYTYLITQESTILKYPDKEAKLHQKIGLKIRQDVTNKLENGNYEIEATILNFNLEMKSNGKITRYDSDTINVMNKYYKSLNFLTLLKFNYEVTPEGVVSKLSGFETIKKKIENDLQLSGLLRSFGSEQFLLEFYNYVPLKSVRVGDKWIGSGILPDMMNLKYDIHYSFKEALAQNIKLMQQASFKYSTEMPMQKDSTSKMNETGTQDGMLLIDPKTRMCLSSDINQQIEIILPTQDKSNQDKSKGDKIAPIKIITHTKRLLVKK